MASVTLGTLRDYWKNVSQWVMGTSASEPKIQLSSRVVELARTDNYTVTAGSAVVFNGTSDNRITKVFSIAKADGKHSYDLMTRNRMPSTVAGANTYLTDYERKASDGGDNVVSGPHEVNGFQIENVIFNNDTVDHNYDIILGGHI